MGSLAVTPSAGDRVLGPEDRKGACDRYGFLLAMVAMVLTAVSYGRVAALNPSAGRLTDVRWGATTFSQESVWLSRSGDIPTINI
jgi:hypothetical protein